MKLLKKLVSNPTQKEILAINMIHFASYLECEKNGHRWKGRGTERSCEHCGVYEHKLKEFDNGT